MIRAFDFDNFTNPYDGFKRSILGERLARLQRLVKSMEVPVLVVVDGWESSGKGYVINDLIRELDPRSYQVHVFDHPTDKEKARPFLWRFWSKIPKKGDIAIFDRSFYFHIMHDLSIKDKTLREALDDIGSIEKDLCADDMVIVKFFLHQKESTQKHRIDELKQDPYRSFLIGQEDERQYENYEKYQKHFDKVLSMSASCAGPWHVVSSESKKSASKMVLGLTIEAMEKGIDRVLGKKNGHMKVVRSSRTDQNLLNSLDPNPSTDLHDYKKRLFDLQKQAREIAYRLYTESVSSVLVFEGPDAGGKGGAIKRLTKEIDPRGYEVVPIGAPDETERKYHYLWRFYRKLPKRGNMTIFDRSWYGRVLVERIEGFAQTEEWDRAYDEINRMENHFLHDGMLVIKFLMHIDPDEQLKRFESRESEPDKIYKITEEDWRNREKWDEYVQAMNEMLARTNRPHAPWVVIPGNEKRYARIRVLETFIKLATAHLENM